MQVTSKRRKDILIVTIQGELDHHTTEEIRDEIDQLLEDPTIKNLIIDAGNLNFMDSSGVGVFIGRYKLIVQRGGKMGVINVSPHIHKIFKVSGLYRLMKGYPDIQQALADMQGV